MLKKLYKQLYLGFVCFIEITSNVFFCGLGESPLTERELNLAELVVDKWKCYQCTSLRVGKYTSGKLINFRSPVLRHVGRHP